MVLCGALFFVLLSSECSKYYEAIVKLNLNPIVQYILFDSKTFCTHVDVQGAQFTASDGVYNASYPETAPAQGINPPDGVVLQVQCTNTNSSGDPLESATYSITGGNSDPFLINETTGVLSWGQDQVLDYENITFYTFDVECVDNSDVNNRAAAIVNVSVLPVNEYAPVITDGLTRVTLSVGEDAPIGTVILSTESGQGQQQYEVEDADDGPDGQITFTLSSQSDSDFLQLFELDRTSGVLGVAQSLFRASSSSVLSGSIIICDTSPPRVECPNLAVTVMLTPSVAMFDPMFNRSRVQVALPESAELGTPVASIVCSDSDLGIGAYDGINIHSVTPEIHADVFGLNSTDDGYGILWLQQPLDYDTLQPQQTVNVVLRCFDNQPTPSVDFADVVVTVLPVNDNAPRFSQTKYDFTINVASDEERICCLVATDADRDVGNQITYSLDDVQGRFTVQNNGEITFDVSTLLDRVGLTFILMAMASDGEFDTTASVSINVIEDTASTISFGVTEIGIVVAVCGGAVLLSAMIGIICCCYLCLSNK